MIAGVLKHLFRFQRSDCRDIAIDTPERQCETARTLLQDVIGNREARMLHDGQDTGKKPAPGIPEQRSALPGAGGLARIGAAALNSIRGLREGIRSEAAIKQEIALLVIGTPLAFFVAANVWTWVAMVSSLLFVLMTEFLNTAIERLCNHVTPQRHEAIRATKDLASAGVFFALVLAALVWGVAVLDRLGMFG